MKYWAFFTLHALKALLWQSRPYTNRDNLLLKLALSCILKPDDVPSDLEQISRKGKRPSPFVGRAFLTGI